MESQIPHQGYAQNNPPGMEGKEDNQQGKTSVFLKKVKAKAKKIKNTLQKKDGNDDQDNNQNDQGHVEEEEEYDDAGDDETVEDSKVHDSIPTNESPAVKNTAAGQNPGGNLGKPTVAAEDRHDSKKPDPQTRPFSQLQDKDVGKYGGSTGRSTATGVADVHVPENKDGSFSSSGTFGTLGSESAANFVNGEGAGHTGQRPKVSTETPTGTEEDSRTPKDRPEVSNYQSKVADPIGARGEEAGITGIQRSFDKMNVSDKPESKPKLEEAPELYKESQDQFSPEPIPPQSTINPDDPGSDWKSFDSNTTEDVPLDNVTKPPSNQSGYTEKLSSATSTIAGSAVAAKNVVASKLGYGGNQDQTATSESTQGGEEIGKSGTTAEHGQKNVATVREKLAPVYEKVSSVEAPMYEKVSSVGSSVVSKVRGTGTGQEGENQKPVGKVTESEEVRERLGGNDDPNREMTETESKIAGKVSPTGKSMVESVKDTVTSWWGGDQKQASEASPGNTHGEEQRFSSSTGEEGAALKSGENGVGEQRLQESGN